MPQNNQTLLEDRGRPVADPALRLTVLGAPHAGVFQHPCDLCHKVRLH